MSDQLLGPSDSSFETGFNPIGEDMRDLAAPYAYPVGVALPGDATGYNSGVDMTGMASQDGIPQANQMGAAYGDGIPDQDGDLASSAGYRIIGSMGTDTSGVELSDITGVFNALENGSGQHGSSDGGPVRGYDSMRGLVLGDSGPAPRGEQDSDRSGPGVPGNGQSPAREY